MAKGRQPRAAGERNRHAKLTEAQVVEIRKRYAAGGVTQRVLGLEYGVYPSHVGSIVTGVKWRHIS